MYGAGAFVRMRGLRNATRGPADEFEAAAARQGNAEDVPPEVVDEITAAGGEAVANYDSVATPEGGASIVQTAVDTQDVRHIDIQLQHDRVVHRTTLEVASVAQNLLPGLLLQDLHAPIEPSS